MKWIKPTPTWPILAPFVITLFVFPSGESVAISYTVKSGTSPATPKPGSAQKDTSQDGLRPTVLTSKVLETTVFLRETDTPLDKSSEKETDPIIEDNVNAYAGGTGQNSEDAVSIRRVQKDVSSGNKVEHLPDDDNDDDDDDDDAKTKEEEEDHDVTDDEEKDDPYFSVQTFVAILVTLLIVLSNCAILLVAAWTDAFSNFNKTFIFSLTFADLLIGLFITPYSIFLSVYRKWVFSSELFCSVGAYTSSTLLAAKLYSLMWLSVDHYVAVRKPERYGVMMSPTRSFCWISFSWIVAISFCCPPLFSFTSANFNTSAFLCLVDTKDQMAYILTAGVLVSLPPVVTLTVTNCYLFTRAFKKRISFYEKVFVELSTRPRNYHITFVFCTLFLILWVPFIAANVFKLGGLHVDKELEFVCCWLGISAGFVQFPVLFLMSPDFRDAMWEISQPPNWCKRTVCACCCRDDPNDAARVMITVTRDVNVITLPTKRHR